MKKQNVSLCEERTQPNHTKYKRRYIMQSLSVDSLLPGLVIICQWIAPIFPLWGQKINNPTRNSPDLTPISLNLAIGIAGSQKWVASLACRLECHATLNKLSWESPKWKLGLARGMTSPLLDRCNNWKYMYFTFWRMRKEATESGQT